MPRMSRSLRVLWRAAPPDPRPAADDLPPGCDLVVERDEARALAHRDTLDVLIDGRPSPLLGFGAVGRQLARMLRGLGMRVSVLRRRPEGDEDGVRVIGPTELPAALARADAILVSLPATPATVGLLDREALARLTTGALVVNVGRSSVIDEDAL
jgi:phosphoglycerate dehydrogenase-like enzyme